MSIKTKEDLIVHLANLKLRFSKNYRFDRNDYVIVKNMCESVGNAIDNGIELDDKFFHMFYDQYIIFRKYKYSGSHVFQECRTVIKNLLHRIILLWDIPEDYIRYLIFADPNYYDILDTFSQKSNFNGFSTDFLDKLINKNHINFNTLTERVTTLLKNQRIDFSKSEYIFKCYNTAFNSKLAKIVKESDYKFQKKDFLQVCINLPISKEIFKVFIEKKRFTLDDECLTSVCLSGSHKALKYILKFRLIISKKHFKACIESDRSSYRWSSSQSKKIPLLLKNNYTIDKEDIIFSLQNRVEIPNLQEYTDIRITPDIIKHAWDREFFPDYYISYANDMDKLYEICSKSSLSKAKKLIKDTSVKPDSSIVELVTKKSGQKPLVRLIVESGGEVTDKSIENAIMVDTSRSSYFPILFPVYKEAVLTKINNLEAKIEQLEKQLKNQSKDPEVKEVIPKEIKEDIFEEEYVDILCIDTSDIKIPSKNKKYKIPTKYADYSGIHKNKKLSFIDIKKNIIKDITDNSMIHKNDKSLILPSDKMKKILQLDDGYVNISDLDDLITLFYD